MDNPILLDIKKWGQTKIALLTICDFIYLLIWLRQVFIAACVVFRWGTQALAVPTQGLHSERASAVVACWFSFSQACGILVSRPRTEWTHVPCTARHFLNHWTTRVKMGFSKDILVTPTLLFQVLWFICALMASLTRWTWVWVNSGSWWWTRRPGVLRFMGL